MFDIASNSIRSTPSALLRQSQSEHLLDLWILCEKFKQQSLRLQVETGSWKKVIERDKEDTRSAYQELRGFLQGSQFQPNRESLDRSMSGDVYLLRIAIAWRSPEYASEMRRFKGVWEYVANRPIAWEGVL